MKCRDVLIILPFLNLSRPRRRLICMFMYAAWFFKLVPSFNSTLSAGSILTRTSPARIWPYWWLFPQRWNTSILKLPLIHLMNWCCTIKCVRFYFQNYYHGSSKVLSAHGRHGRPRKLIGDQVNIFPTSPTRPPRQFSPKRPRGLVQHVSEAVFGLQKRPN